MSHKRMTLYARAKRRAKQQGYEQFADDPKDAAAYSARVIGWLEGYEAAVRDARRRVTPAARKEGK